MNSNGKIREACARMGRNLPPEPGRSRSIESGQGQTTVPSNGSFRMQAPHSTQASSASSIMSTPAISASISPQLLQTNKVPSPTSAHMAVTAAESRTKKHPPDHCPSSPLCSVQQNLNSRRIQLIVSIYFLFTDDKGLCNACDLHSIT
jgi:hypothetical protein